MNITIRKGTPKDSSWIIGLLREGVKGGHYGDSISAQAPVFLDSIFKYNALGMMKLRDGIQAPCRIPASLLVADVDGNSASFLITLQEDNELELHLTSTKKEFRRQGCFNELVRHVSVQQKKGTRIYARCYKKSTWAINGLKKEGYTITKSGDPDELSIYR